MGSNDSRWKECLVGNRETQYTRITSVWAEHYITCLIYLTQTPSPIYQGAGAIAKLYPRIKRYQCDVKNKESRGKYAL